MRRRGLGIGYHIRGPIDLFHTMLTLIGLPLIVRILASGQYIDDKIGQVFAEGNAARLGSCFPPR
jgi:hypothetical protein